MQSAPEMIGGYKVVRELGRGAMGTVYLAYQDSLGRDLAIKLMANEFVRDEEFVERFRREGRIAARLRHPNIVQVYDFSDRDGLYYIAMEYLGSRTLKCYMRELGRMPVEEAVRLTDQLLAALDHAHRQGIVHRDIKPANVMVTDNNDAALTDFSIAQMKSASKLTQTGSVLGTPEYMAPEQFEGKADGRSDLYATGVILYEMLTGFSPFHADTIAEIMKKQLFTAPDPPTMVDFTIPEAISQVVVKSLAKNPDERYQNAAEMRQALRAALGVSNFPQSSIRPAPREILQEREKEKEKKPPDPPTVKTCAACGANVNKQRFCPGCGHDTTRPAVKPSPAPPISAPAPAPVVVKPAVVIPPPAPVDRRAQPPTPTPPPPPAEKEARPSLVIRPNPAPPPPPPPPPPTPVVVLPEKPVVPEKPMQRLTPEPPAPAPSPPTPAVVTRPKVAGGVVRFLEDQGTMILGLASVGCFALVVPSFLTNIEFFLMLACGGILGMICLVPACFLLSVFLFFRRAAALRVAAPFCVAAGLLIALLMVIIHIFQGAG